jgi:hypothetical protein
MEASQMPTPPTDDQPGVVLRSIGEDRMLEALPEGDRNAGLARLDLMVNTVLDRLTAIGSPASDEANGS